MINLCWKILPTILLTVACEQQNQPVETIQTDSFQASCLVDGNDDDVHDVLAVKSATIPTVVLLDGLSGKVLWEKQILPEYKLHCISPQWFVIDMANGQVNIMNTKRLSTTMPVLLTGRLTAVAKENNCLALTNDKKQTIGFDLLTKKITKCPPFRSAAVGLKQERKITIDARIYTVQNREEMRILVSENEDVLWSKSFAYQMSDDMPFLVAGGLLVFVAQKITEPATTVVVGVDTQTGEEKYTLSSSESISLIGYNGRYMTLQWGDSIRGVTLLEGKPTWKVGGENGD